MRLSIHNLQADTLIGVYKSERKAKRKVVMDLDITYDAIIKHDRLDETLDYAQVEQAIVTSLAKQKFQLLESLAEHIAHLVLEMDRVQEVTVWLGKPGALKHADNVVVEYRLSK